MKSAPMAVVEEECPPGAFLRSDGDNVRLGRNAVLALDPTGIIGELRNPVGGIATATHGCEFFQPTWRELSATLARKQDPSGGAGSLAPQSVHNRIGQVAALGDRESGCEENDALVKEFMVALGEYFGMEGGKQRVELRLNTAALGTRRGPPSSSSDFRGVTRHRRTKKWESHIWYDKRQLYLGGFKAAVDAAKAHDIMGLKLKRSLAHTNFEPQGYQKLMRFLEKLSKESVIDALRLCSKGNGIARASHRNRATRVLRKSSIPRNRHQDIGRALTLRALPDVDRNSSMHHLCMGDNIHATLLPRSWSSDRRMHGLKPGMIRYDPRLVGGNMVDYVQVPGHLNATCEMFDSSWRPDSSDPSSAPFLVSDRQGDLFAMDGALRACTDGQQESSNEFDVARRRLERSREGHNKIVLTLPSTAGEGFSMPRMGPSLQELLHSSSAPGDGCVKEQGEVSPTSSPNTALFQTPDTLIVKVPVIPSKVIRYPTATLSAPSFPQSASFPMATSARVLEQQMTEDVPMQFIVPGSSIKEEGSSLDQVIRPSARNAATHYGVGIESQQHSQLGSIQPSDNNFFPFGMSDGRSVIPPTGDLGNGASLGDVAY